MRSPDTTEEEKSQLYKKAGLTDAEIEQMAEMRKNFGGGGGSAAVGGGVVAAADLPAAATGREDRNSERGLSNGKAAGKPIVKLVDVMKTYVMGHAGGGGLLGRRRNQVSRP